MKEMSDDELQQWLDGKPSLNGNIPLNDDAEAYRNLFEALGKEPETGLSYNFAAKVTRKIATEQKRNNELRLNIIVAVIFITVISAVFGLFTVFAKVNITSVPYKWLLILIPVIFIAIQYFDQQLVKPNIFKRR
ncbi:hypothetical protein JN11_01697 [Mucilaginibacter frigoritolerans]|jgi:hypothetical protein|uniref:Uncharacterized protein n=1 Tax=Mucilaginibacter frigoritolerans TaxID=652788 RepID=A0A562U6W3_9SPHI|nr:hypothetical protein [Mucilaginibacter frigoritolerans]TWJ01546.1 hypothetical protein JN11_01697 [Mucilaginibacter frigoritolerans]